jgi:hypothetical protein
VRGGEQRAPRAADGGRADGCGDRPTEIEEITGCQTDRNQASTSEQSVTDEDLLALLRAIDAGDDRSGQLDSSGVARRLGWSAAATAASLGDAKSSMLIWGIRVGGTPAPCFEDLEVTVQGRRLLTAAAPTRRHALTGGTASAGEELLAAPTSRLRRSRGRSGWRSDRGARPARIVAVGVAHREVVAAASGVDHDDVGGAQPEVGTGGVVDEDVVTAAQRVPLEAQHHDGTRFEGSSTSLQGAHSHQPSRRSPGSTSTGKSSRQRQQRRLVRSGVAAADATLVRDDTTSS